MKAQQLIDQVTFDQELAKKGIDWKMLRQKVYKYQKHNKRIKK